MEKIYLAGLHYIGFTHKKLHKIFKEEQNYKEILENINYDFLKQNGFLDKQIEIILERYKKVNLKFLKSKLEKRKARIITIFDEEYPKNLKNIINPPFLFYIRGKIDNHPKLAIIGSRKITNYGNKTIEVLVPDLTKYFTIISGGAAGCDTKAHKETIKNNGRTISVIGTGINLDYPVENEKLFGEIADLGGAVISIFPVGEVGNSYNFPVRNEIVAGLSEGIIVIEAREKSGSLITVKLGLDLGKEIFAIPGDISKWGSVGTNNLIKNGEAKLVLNSSDILEEFNISKNNKTNLNKQPENNFSDKIEELIYNTLIIESLNINDLSKKINIDISTISFKISMMEITGLLKRNLSGKYEIK